MRKEFKYFTLIVLMMFSFSAAAEMFQQEDVIRLQATGEMNVEPDIAILKIAVTTEDEIAGEAISENARKMNQVVQVLEKEIKDPTKIQTSRFQLNPVTQYDQETRTNNITGYRVTNEVSIEYAKLDMLGELIDDVVEVGSNQIQQLTFSRSDLEDLQAKALAEAILKGTDQANMMADVAGVQVSRVVEISTYMAQPGPVPMYRESAMMSDAKTSILPGEMTIAQQVNMTFAIE